MKILLLSLVIMISSNVFAQKNIALSNLGNLIETQIMNSSEALDEINPSMNSEKEWFLKVVRLRIRPSIGVEIDWFAKAKIKAQIELYFTR